jgi:probable F420-dependent oxidoreductase
MRIGAAFPTTRIGSDPIAVRDFAQGVEGLGYAFIEAYDHVLGASREVYPDFSGPYSTDDPFYEVFVLFGYLAGLTRSIEFMKGVLVLPQRQTALVAKQAAIIDVLSGGRLRLGVGVGWNSAEFEALGEDFHNRGRRCEEQIEVLRALWTEDVVTFHGRWHTINAAGINPLPVQRPIPIWIGGRADVVTERVGRLADGWVTLYDQPDEVCRGRIEAMRDVAERAGRRREDIAFGAWVSLGGKTPDQWADEAAAWRALGVTHLTVNTEFHDPPRHIASSAQTVDEHLVLFEQYRDAVMR